jgi:hypothetical protein
VRLSPVSSLELRSTILFVIAGFVVGFGFAAGIHKLAYRLLDVSGRRSRALSGWAWLFAYTFLPMLGGLGSMVLTGWLTFLVVTHLL